MILPNLKNYNEVPLPLLKEFILFLQIKYAHCRVYHQNLVLPPAKFYGNLSLIIKHR